MSRTATAHRPVASRLAAAATALALVIVGAVSSAPEAHADSFAVDTRVSVSESNNVISGTYAVWRVTAINEGTTTTAGPVVIEFTYAAPVQPPTPAWKTAYSDVHGEGPDSRNCVVDTSTVTATCTMKQLAPGAEVTATIVGKTNLGTKKDEFVGWSAHIPPAPGDGNVANDTEYSGTNTQHSFEPTSEHLTGGSSFDRITAGRSFISPNAQYSLTVTVDGNLIESSNGRVLWSSNTAGNPGAYFILEEDGNGVVYSADGRVLWKSGISREAIPYPELAVQNNGLVVSADVNGTLWTSKPTGLDALVAPGTLKAGQTLRAGSSTLTVRTDGNVVVQVAKKIAWQSKTKGNPGAYLKLQGDGNLVVISKAGKALWAAHTKGTGSHNRLALSSSGPLRLYSGGKVVWHRG